MRIPFIDNTEPEHVGDSEKEQNARLRASHAQMLKALKGVVRVADRATDEFDAARAAIEVASEFAEPVPTVGHDL